MVHSLINRLHRPFSSLTLLELYEAQAFMPAVGRPRDVDGLDGAERPEQVVDLLVIHSEF